MNLRLSDPSTGLPVVSRRAPSRITPARIYHGALDSIGRALTDLVSVMAPGLAARMAASRAAYHHLRSYEATDHGRLTQHRWPISHKDPDGDLYGKQARIRGLARDQVRNNPLAAGLRRTRRNSVVGDADAGQGITLKAAVLNGEGKPDAELNYQIQEQWERYRDRLCFQGRWGWTDLLSLADEELSEAGETLFVMRQSPGPDSDLPFSLEALEADRLPMDTDLWLGEGAVNGEITLNPGEEGLPVSPGSAGRSKHAVRHGIEYNDAGQIVAYHILNDHPGSISWNRQSKFTTRRWLRENVIHYFEGLRAEQTRGVSAFVSLLARLSDLHDLIAWELVAAKSQAMFGLHFSGQVGGIAYASGGVSNPPLDALGNEYTQLQPGMVTKGPQQATFYQGNRPGNTFLPFCQALMRLVATGYGIGYSATSKDYSQGSYSALRQEDNEDARQYRSWQGIHARHLCRKVWSRFVRALVLSGKIPITNAEWQADPWRYERCEVKVPGRAHINPLQEITAEAVALSNGLKSLDDIRLSAQDSEDRLEELGRLKSLADDAGLTLAWAHGVAKPKPEQAEKNKLSDAIPASIGDTDELDVASVVEGSVQNTGLNGAQIAALTDLATQVAQGQMPAESAKAIAQASLPFVGSDVLDAIFSKLEAFQPQITTEGNGNVEAKADEAA